MKHILPHSSSPPLAVPCEHSLSPSWTTRRSCGWTGPTHQGVCSFPGSKQTVRAFVEKQKTKIENIWHQGLLWVTRCSTYPTKRSTLISVPQSPSIRSLDNHSSAGAPRPLRASVASRVLWLPTWDSGKDHEYVESLESSWKNAWKNYAWILKISCTKIKLDFNCIFLGPSWSTLIWRQNTSQMRVPCPQFCTLTTCVTSGKLFTLAETWFCHLQDGECSHVPAIRGPHKCV